jgi:hypothetical protein
MTDEAAGGGGWGEQPSDPRGDTPLSLGTQGYPTGTEGYPTTEEHAHASSQGAGRPNADEPPPSPFFEANGFASRREFIDHMNEQREQLVEEWRTRLPTPRVPGRELASSRQVNVKLRGRDSSALDEAAALYGLAPTTLARLLVNRGVAAILGNEVEKEEEFGTRVGV